MRKLLVPGVLAFVLALLLVGVQVAQTQTNSNPSGAAVTNQSGSRGDAAMRCDSAASGTAVNTLTLQNPGAGLSQYITYIGAWGAISGSVVTATPTALSTSGITGTTPAFQPINTATTATLVTGGLGGGAMVFNPPIKSNTNTAVTLTGGAVISGVTSLVQACYYSSA